MEFSDKMKKRKENSRYETIKVQRTPDCMYPEESGRWTHGQGAVSGVRVSAFLATAGVITSTFNKKVDPIERQGSAKH